MSDVDNAGGGAGEVLDSTPQPIELNDDSFIKVPGQDKPVKYGEYFKGLKGELTRKSQELPRISQERDQLKKELERIRRESNSRRPSQNSRPGPGQREQLLEDLKSLPYLNGQKAADMVGKILNQMDGYGNHLKQRDAITGLLMKKLMELDSTVKGFKSKNVNEQFNELTSRTVKSLDLPDELQDFAQLVYLAHEGDDLNEQFPEIFKENWEKVANAVRAMDKKKAEEARRKPWVPREGGRGTASKGLKEKFLSPREVAAQFHGTAKASEG